MKCVAFVFVWVVTSSAYPFSHLPRIRGRRIPNPRQIYSNQDMLLQTEQRNERRNELRNHEHLRGNSVNALTRNSYEEGYHQINSFHDSRLTRQLLNRTQTRNLPTTNTHRQNSYDTAQNATFSITGSRHRNSELVRQPQREHSSVRHSISRLNHSRDSAEVESVRPMIQQTENQPRVRTSLYLSDNPEINQPQQPKLKSNEGLALRSDHPNRSPLHYHHSRQSLTSQLGTPVEEVLKQERQAFPQYERSQNLYGGHLESTSNDQESSQRLNSHTHSQNPLVNSQLPVSGEDSSSFQQAMYSNDPRNNQQIKDFSYFNNQPNNRLYPNLQSIPQQLYGRHNSYPTYGSIRQPPFNYQNIYRPYMNGRQAFANGDRTQELRNFAPSLAQGGKHSVNSNQNPLESSEAREVPISSEDHVISVVDKSPAEIIANQYDANVAPEPGSQTTLHNNDNAQSDSFQSRETGEASQHNELASDLPHTSRLNVETTARHSDFFGNQADQHFFPRASGLANNVKSDYITGSLPDGQSAYFHGALSDTNQQPSVHGNNNDVIPFNHARQHHVTSQSLPYLGNQPESNNRRLFLHPQTDESASNYHSTRDVQDVVNPAHQYNNAEVEQPRRRINDLVSHEENEQSNDGLQGNYIFSKLNVLLINSQI